MVIERLKFLTSVIIYATLVATAGYLTGYDKGYSTGTSRGITVSLDTIKTILEEQLKSDSTVTRLILINPDTNAYVLSPKTIKVD